ncbi:MAG TPA: MASE1 domain-containing protein [Solirubrobacteraceae bacterium]|nr:MASE1 domain-containing protein [Solirubrobacteraceae bacterium]
MTALRIGRYEGPVVYAGAVALAAGAYYLAGRLGLELAYLDGAVAALWPPAGLGLAVLFLFGIRLWPAIVIGDLFLGDFSTPLGTVLAQTVGNTLSLVTAAWLLRRYTQGRGSLERVTDVLAFVIAALIAAVISAAFGPLALRLGDVIAPDELGRVVRTWTLGDAAGVLVVAPLILTWASLGVRGFGRDQIVEGAVVLALLVALATLPPQRDVPYIVFPGLLWAAIRFGPRGAATATFVVCSITVWNTAQNDGPFVRESITESLLTTQLFIATSALTSLLLAAVTAERMQAEVAQRELAGEQASLRRVAMLVAAAAPQIRVFEQVTREVAELLGVPGASLVRYDEDPGTATVVGGWSADGLLRLPVASTIDLDGDTVIARVLRSGTPQRAEYAEATGALAAKLQSAGYRGAVAAPVLVGGRLWGALAAGTRSPASLPEGAEQRLGDFAELVAQAIANTEAHEQLAASRARIVEAGDAERRRLERNLHDGAQQRLVSVALDLRLVDATLRKDPAAAGELLAKAQDGLSQGLDELRELARGIHPAVLTDRGLGPAIESLANRSPVPIEITEMPDERLAGPVEAAAYYVVAEAMTNVAKYAQATHAVVSVSRSNGQATVTVADDGIGGADPTRGTGLRGLADRLEALEGRLDVQSSPGSGTRISAEIPCA